MHRTPTAYRTLERGGACIFCRRRKVKCDGARPACSRCSENGHLEDCEYADSRARSEGHLEASIARLEQRILQLGGTLPTSPQVVIHEPRLDGQPLSNSFSSWNARRRDHSQQPTQVEVTLPENWWQTPVPPHHVTKILLDVFARHASQFGFFLNGPRIIKAVFSPDSQHPISSSLLSSILLFGIHLSGSPALRARESVFLERATRSHAPVQPYPVVQNIQAEVLIAQYFLRQGRFLEAMHRINTAASLSIGCGLHRLHNGPDNGRNAYALPSTRDAIEQGERVNAFWTITSFHKIFSIMMQWPSSVSTILDEQIDLPWPLEMDVYESGIVPVNPQRQFTMKTFLEDPMAANFEAANSSLAQHAKAAALFERASHIGGNRTNLADPEQYAQFILFEHGLNQVIQTLPSFDNINIRLPIDTVRQRLVNFTLYQVAVIQLHGAFDNPASIRKCLGAVRAVVTVNERIPNMQAWENIDSTMGTLWVAMCQIVIRGIATIKKPHAAIASRGWSASVSPNDYPVLKSDFASITRTMGMFSPRCLLMEYQLNKVHESYNALCR